jgi:hypothetical protein
LTKDSLKGTVALVLAGAHFTGLVALITIDAAAGRLATRLAVKAGLAIAVLVLAAVGVHRLVAANRSRAGEQPRKLDYRHAARVFFVVGIIAVAALAGRELLVPKTYGQYGEYRGAAVAEAMNRQPRHAGEKACGRCHAKEVRLHDKDAHARVECEVCHGAGYRHISDPKKHKLNVPKGKKGCLVCHRRLPARPAAFAQIDWKEHYRFVGVKDPSVECKACHSPHEPLFMDRDLRTARLHPVVHRCRDCHAGRANENLERPKDHPKIFECRYCHKELVADLVKRPHKKMRCTTCHVFFKETAFAGRIIRDTDPRFCLLCHRRTKFRSKDAPPSIEWPKHVDDPKMRCTECHQEKIHDPNLLRGRKGITAQPQSKPAKKRKAKKEAGD